MVDHEYPYDGVRYIHDGTDDLVEYVGRDDGKYVFSVNSGDRTLRLPVADWNEYRDYLIDGGRS